MELTFILQHCVDDRCVINRAKKQTSVLRMILRAMNDRTRASVQKEDAGLRCRSLASGGRLEVAPAVERAHAGREERLEQHAELPEKAARVGAEQVGLAVLHEQLQSARERRLRARRGHRELQRLVEHRRH